MLLCQQNYDITIMYCPIKAMLIVDAFFHYVPPDAPEIPINIAINQVHNTLQKKKEFHVAICNYPLLWSLADKILTGWQDNINHVSYPFHPNHAHHDVLKVEDGLILHGKALIIQPTEREKVLQTIREGHLGITKYQYHTQQHVYWHRINLDIKHTFKTCVTCQQHHPWEP